MLQLDSVSEPNQLTVVTMKLTDGTFSDKKQLYRNILYLDIGRSWGGWQIEGHLEGCALAVASPTRSVVIGSISKSRQSMAERTCALSEVQEVLVSHTAEDIAFLAEAKALKLLG